VSDPTQPPPPEENPFAPPPEGITPPPADEVPTPPPADIPAPPPDDIPVPPPASPAPPPSAPPAYQPPPPAAAPAYGTPPPPAPPVYAAAPPAYGAPAATVPNNMGLAIGALVAGLCCASIIGLAFGIVAVVFAGQVNGKAAVGDVAGATESARKARLFSIITFVLAAIGIVLSIIIAASGGFNGSFKIGG
jgi:Interferon-induced transmembrane protein